MTKIITRYFETPKQATAARYALMYDQGVAGQIIRTYVDPSTLVEKLTALQVSPESAKAYQDRLAKGGAVLLVEAGYRPLGVARMAREAAAANGAVSLGDVIEEVEVKDPTYGQRGSSVLRSHPRFMSGRTRGSRERGNFHMADWPIPLISRRKPYNGTLFYRHARMAKWPLDLLVPGEKRYGRFPFGLLVPGNKFMAKFPFGHIVPGHKFMAKFPFGHIVPGHKHMAKFPFGHIVPGHKFMAKFPFGHLVPGHRRMANLPFPLLINGKPNTNSLVPSKVRYGRFPFGLLVPGNKFMAKFPFGHIVPGHKYMANWILPHTKAKAS